MSGESDRRLRDVLREVERRCAFDRVSVDDARRLASELRALAPLLRKAIEAMDWADRDTRETLGLMADELEAK